ncbi:MAG: DUF4783 domain-containing protein [Bacteroidota bacterium]
MNFVIKLVSSLVILFTVPCDIPYVTIEKAMESNDAKTIINLGTEKVLLNTLGKEGAYTHSQAQLVLNEFFTKNPKGTFSFIFKGKETSDGIFAVGNYLTKSESFRTTFHFRTIKSESRLESLTISN